MTTQIIEPTRNVFNVQVQIHNDLIGKKVVLSYEMREPIEVEKTTDEKFVKASDVFKDCRVDLSNFKFNRDEANNYE